MGYRKRILRELKDLYDQKGHDAYTFLDPQNILKKPGNDAYAAAVNTLLAERLIIGISTAGKKPAFRLNPDLIDEIKKELDWCRSPISQWIITSIIAVCGLAVAVIKFFL